MKSFYLIFATVFCSTVASATRLELDSLTILLDGSNLAAGNTYKAVFQLNSGGPLATTEAYLSNFVLGGGTGIAPSTSDLTAGLYAIGPNPLATAGIWQPNGTLSLTVNPGNSSALFTQDFQAGSLFSLDVYFFTNLPPGEIPGAFVFQLYDPTLSTLLYEAAFDINDTTINQIPEPAMTLPLAMALVFLVACHRRTT